MARSILSFGMFSWRAAITAARSRGFMAGSGVPSLAATVISRASLPNSFDFWASCLPLRCMMFLNWEWPAMQGLLDSSGGDGGEARPYRPPIDRNQRFADPRGYASTAACRNIRQLLTMISCSDERISHRHSTFKRRYGLRFVQKAGAGTGVACRPAQGPDGRQRDGYRFCRGRFGQGDP